MISSNSTHHRGPPGHLGEEILEHSAVRFRATFPEVGGEYELTCSAFLAQATGNCAGLDFCFVAKHGAWEFEALDEKGHSFPIGDQRRFVRAGQYEQSREDALSVPWALRILRACLSEWWS